MNWQYRLILKDDGWHIESYERDEVTRAYFRHMGKTEHFDWQLTFPTLRQAYYFLRKDFLEHRLGETTIPKETDEVMSHISLAQ